PTLAVADDTHIDRRESCRPQLRRAQRLSLAIADALEEVLPQRFGVVLFQATGDKLAFHVLQPFGHSRTALHALRQDLQAELLARLIISNGSTDSVAEANSRQPAADDFLDRVIVDHRGGDN